jgi:hypothetical protein
MSWLYYLSSSGMYFCHLGFLNFQNWVLTLADFMDRENLQLGMTWKN